MTSVERVIILVFDSVGVGELPDAAMYGDQGSNTLANTAQAVGGLHLPNLGALGLGNIITITGVPPSAHPAGSYGKMTEVSAGKDTTIGHWELAGIVTNKPFPTYPNGFPPEVVDAFEARIGRKVLGNYPASGTEIIEALGKEHIETGRPIVYTSADSVFQIACHEDIVPVEQLYQWCGIAREMLVEPHNVSRVIARPFTGEPGNFKRTERRKDFSLQPPGKTILDAVYDSGGEVVAIGKIHDIFADRGISRTITTSSNAEGMMQTTRVLKSGEGRLVFTNLVDFDMLYGHRNDARGYAQALEQVDDMLPDLLGAMQLSDLLIITSDHGCDPTTPSTDHSREFAPLLVYAPSAASGINLGVRKSFCDVAATAADLLGVKDFECGVSFAHEVGLLS